MGCDIGERKMMTREAKAEMRLKVKNMPEVVLGVYD